MSLNQLVDMYNQKLNTNVTQSTHPTSQSTFTSNAEFHSDSDPTNNYPNVRFTPDESSALLFDIDSSRFHYNDRVLAGDTIRPPPHQQPRIERIKLADKIDFSAGDAEIDDYEQNEEYSTRYPDIKHQLNIISAQQAKIPPANININPAQQIQQLIQQGKMKNFHGYVNYPYNYIESPWYSDECDEQQGCVNLNPPRSYLTGVDLQSSDVDEREQMELPSGIPQDVICQDRYELIPLPKMIYENFVPLVATRRIVYRRPTIDRVQRESSRIGSKLAEVEETTFQF